MTLKCRLEVTQGANLCTTNTLLKSTDPGLSFCWWQYGYSFVCYKASSGKSYIQHFRCCITVVQGQSRSSIL